MVSFLKFLKKSFGLIIECSWKNHYLANYLNPTSNYFSGNKSIWSRCNIKKDKIRKKSVICQKKLALIKIYQVKITKEKFEIPTIK